MAAGIIILILFWTVIIVWPNDWDVSQSAAWRMVPVVVAIVLGIVAVGTSRLGDTLQYITPFAAAGSVGSFLIALGGGDLSLSDAERFGIGVGGIALGGLLLGIVRYGTIRPAASTAAVVLVIGVLTFPGGKEVVGEANVGAIVGWMALLIGINGAADAFLQAAGRYGKGD